uniref:Uncharacterized protein n=1 Tax=Panagrolaimus davidi TaxID=227884 RepID=A0A914PZ52_9BILA
MIDLPDECRCSSYDLFDCPPECGPSTYGLCGGPVVPCHDHGDHDHDHHHHDEEIIPPAVVVVPAPSYQYDYDSNYGRRHHRGRGLFNNAKTIKAEWLILFTIIGWNFIFFKWN